MTIPKDVLELTKQLTLASSLVTALGSIGVWKLIAFIRRSILKRRDRAEEQTLQAILDEFQRRSWSNNGNRLCPEAGSEAERICRKLAARGQLVSTFGGYSLPEFSGSGSRAYPPAFGGGLYGGSGQLY